jgi:hypothetical protein
MRTLNYAYIQQYTAYNYTSIVVRGLLPSNATVLLRVYEAVA